jgi:hypothetical protein
MGTGREPGGESGVISMTGSEPRGNGPVVGVDKTDTPDTIPFIRKIGL